MSLLNYKEKVSNFIAIRDLRIITFTSKHTNKWV
jgi:hypothetical protein